MAAGDGKLNERVLVIVAHPDDEVLGCGGTIARHVASGDAVHMCFLTDGVGARGDDAGAAARRNAVTARRRTRNYARSRIQDPMRPLRRLAAGGGRCGLAAAEAFMVLREIEH